MKKIIALLIAFVMVFSLAGCSKGSGRDANTIYLDFEIVDNGYGYKWLEDACDEFEELVKDKDYGGGKKPGVVCKVKPAESLTDLQSMRRSGVEVFFGGGAASSLVRTGNLLDITDVVLENNYRDGVSIGSIIQNSDYDVVTANSDGSYSHTKTGTSIADKMYDDTLVLNTVTNEVTGETKFYTIPTHEIYAGMTFDKDLFDEYCFYFAKDYNAIPFDSQITSTTVYFVEPTNKDNKSCGPDGIFGTYDDGMPTSLVELIQLYEYIAYNQVWPLQVPGQYLYESDFATDGILGALLGKDKALTSYNFTGEVDIVTGLNTSGNAFVNENGQAFTFSTDTDFYKPEVVTKTVTEATGYYTTWSVERYYTLLFLQICKEQGWFAPGHNPDVNTFTHQQSQYQFISSGYDNGSGAQGPRVATMATGSYWYNESLNSFTNFDDFYAINGKDCAHRNLLWMPLPVNIFTSVTGEQDGFEEEDYLVEVENIGIVESTKGEEQVITQVHANNVYFNDNVRSDAQAYAALKDWIRFFHSDDQLEKTTIRQGFRKALNYEVRELEDIDNVEERAAMKQLMADNGWMGWNQDGTVAWEGFYKQLSSYVDDSYLFRFTSTSDIFIDNSSKIFKRGEYSKVTTDSSGMGYLKNLFKVAGYNAMDAFGSTMLKFNTWDSLCEGGAGRLQDDLGNDIIYAGYIGAVPA